MKDIQATADSIANAISHPVTVQLITQGTGIWGNVATGLITGVLTGGVTLTGIWLAHRFTLLREKQASDDKLKQERLFIATELIFVLEQYAEGCAQVAGDYGELISEENKQAEFEPTVGYPALPDFEKVSGDWRSLPADLMYRIRELPVLRNEAMRAINDAGENSVPPDHDAYFSVRQYEFSRLGLKAIHLARLLRKLCKLPRSRLNESSWSAQPEMLRILHRERKKRPSKPEEKDVNI